MFSVVQNCLIFAVKASFGFLVVKLWKLMREGRTHQGIGTQLGERLKVVNNEQYDGA